MIFKKIATSQRSLLVAQSPKLLFATAQFCFCFVNLCSPYIQRNYFTFYLPPSYRVVTLYACRSLSLSLYQYSMALCSPSNPSPPSLVSQGVDGLRDHEKKNFLLFEPPEFCEHCKTVEVTDQYGLAGAPRRVVDCRRDRDIEREQRQNVNQE